MDDTTTLAEARAYLNENWTTGKGIACPCCHQNVYLYPRRIYATSAIGIINLYHLTREQPDVPYFHIKAIERHRKSGGGDFAKFKTWGLVEEQLNTDTKKRTSGYWRITPKGERYVRGELTIPKVARIYNKRFFYFEGEQVSIKDALGKNFDYAELMEADYA